MSKIINLKTDEDVTSLVEYLWETGAKDVYFVTPKNSAFLKNIIGMKLLKREADRLDKTAVLITKDEVAREMAKRVGLSSRVSLPKGIDEEVPLPPDEDVLKEVSPQKYESLIEEEVRLRREKITHSPEVSDIKQVPSNFPAEKYEEPESIEDDSESEPKRFSFKSLIKKHDDLDSYLMEKSRSDEAELPKFEIFSSKGRTDSRKDQETGDREKNSSFFFSLKFLSFFIIAAFLVAAGAFYFILPKAEITIMPKTDSIIQSFSLVADKSISKVDADQKKFPAQLIKVDKKDSKEFITTGQRQLNDKARGTMTIYNEYSSSPQSLVEKTRFVSESGKVFRLAKSITVPGAKIEEGKIVASSIEAEVVADEPGEQYNIGPGKFTIPGFQGTPKYTAFFGQTKSSTSGGATGLVRVVSQEDFDKAKNELWQGLQSAVQQELKTQVSDEQKLLDEAIKEEMSLADSSVAVGSKADSFTVTVKGTATALFFDEKDIFDLAAENSSADLNQQKIINEKNSRIDYSEVKADFVKGQLSFKAKVNEQIVWQIDADNLKRLIAGKNEEQVRQIFNQKEEINEARVLFWPFWVKAVPSSLDKIKITVSQD